jgi:hypothetical protein
LPAITFIRLNLNDHDPGDTFGAALYLNLRTNDMNGTILAASSAVSLTNGFTGPVSFFFSSDVPLTPNATYAYEIVLQAGSGPWNVSGAEYFYPGGTSFFNGVPNGASDQWFREGVIVPEPSSAGLILLAAAALACVRRSRANGR